MYFFNRFLNIFLYLSIEICLLVEHDFVFFRKKFLAIHENVYHKFVGQHYLCRIVINKLSFSTWFLFFITKNFYDYCYFIVILLQWHMTKHKVKRMFDFIANMTYLNDWVVCVRAKDIFCYFCIKKKSTITLSYRRLLNNYVN